MTRSSRDARRDGNCGHGPGTAQGPAVDVAAEARSSGSTACIVVPVAAPPSGAYRQRHIDVHLDATQAEGLRRIFDGLQAAAAKLGNGRFINSPADAVRWVLERVPADVMETGT